MGRILTPGAAAEIARTLHEKLGALMWGKYGFGNAFNIDHNWYDPEVIGIDLGMVLVAIENYRTGLVWNLFTSGLAACFTTSSTARKRTVSLKSHRE